MDGTGLRLRNRALVLIPVGFLGVFFLYPLATILIETVASAEGLDALARVLTTSQFLEVIWFTVWQAAVSTVATLLLGLPAAWAIARYSFPGRRIFRALVTVPFVLPTVVVASAVLTVIGPDGFVGRDLSGTVWAVLIAHVFYNVAVVIRIVGGFWSQLDPATEEAARTLGASRMRAFLTITLPRLRGALGAAAAIVFLFSFTSFGVVLILGGIGVATIEVAIYQQAVSFLDFAAAGALAVIQLVLVAGLLLAYGRYVDTQRGSGALRIVDPPRPATGRARLAVAGVIGATSVVMFVPLLVLVRGAFVTGSGIGLANFAALSGRTRQLLVVPPAEALANSLVIAVAAAAIATVVGMTAAWALATRNRDRRQGLDLILMLPLGTSAVTIGFGFLLALDAPVDLRASPLLLPIGHAIVAIPFVVRTALPVLRTARARYREAGAVLGASPRQVFWKIDVPILGRALAVGAGFALVVSLGEFGATAFIARPDAPTLPVAIFRYLSIPGTYPQALAMSVILMALTAALVLAVDRFNPGSEL